MRKILFICAICAVCLSETIAKGKKELTILHTNDTHSCILPLSENLADTMLADRGGFLRRIAMLKEERAKDPDLLYFDSGDFSQGSPYYNMYMGDVEVGLMNQMGIDASTIGNHEFDFGLDNMARLFKMANFPILCSNYDFTGTVLEGIVKPYTIIKRKGIKIGVFALDPELEGLISTQNCPGVKFLDPTNIANEMAAMLKNEKKCDIVICISHLGWQDKPNPDPTVFCKTRGIDLVLGGHSHTYFETLRYITDLDGKQIPVDQNGKHGIFVGKLTLKFDKK
ncbi:MAG: metallophosphatase [Prevotella sp.]|nr:metallophosphatase [Prevotella sp.]